LVAREDIFAKMSSRKKNKKDVDEETVEEGAESEKEEQSDQSEEEKYDDAEEEQDANEEIAKVPNRKLDELDQKIDWMLQNVKSIQELLHKLGGRVDTLENRMPNMMSSPIRSDDTAPSASASSSVPAYSVMNNSILHSFPGMMQVPKAPTKKKEMKIKVKEYQEDTSFADWLQSFERLASLNEYTAEHRKVLILNSIPVKFTSKLKDVLKDRAFDLDSMHYLQFKEVLLELFYGESEIESVRHEIEQCSRKKDESVESYGLRLKTLFERAHLSSDIFGLKMQFIKGIWPTKLKENLQLVQKSVKTYAELVDLAKSQDRSVKSDTQVHRAPVHSVQTQQTNKKLSWSKDGKPICLLCKKTGHMKRDCRFNQQNKGSYPKSTTVQANAVQVDESQTKN
jgi:hypothetical protein